MRIWQNDFKDIKHQSAIPDPIWKTIDSEIHAMRKTVPSLFMRGMTDIWKHRSWMTADDYSNFLLYVGPAVLHGRLSEPYYQHFLELRNIVKRFLEFGIPRGDIEPGGSLTEACEAWVEKYERYV
jgi:hypothetical protein